MLADEFDPQKVARYTDKRIDKLTLNPSIIRNRMKIEAGVRNAREFLAIQVEFGSSIRIAGASLMDGHD
jgi:DNA-3-methyladenine glycosylase I